MRQAIHIFLKDSRQFRVPIAISLAWMVVFVAAGIVPWHEFNRISTAWDRARFAVQPISQNVIPALWWLLVALIFHADALPGDRQFWVTRPYSRLSLALAKAMFVFVYLTLPMTLAQAALIIGNGLAIGPALPGLVFAQALFIAALVVPIAGVAALTSTLAQFVIALIVLFPAAAFVMLNTGDGLMHWVWGTIGAIGAVSVGGVVLLLQFTRRHTQRSRALGLAGALVVAAVLMVFPWTTAFALQSALGPSKPDVLRAALTPLPKPVPRHPAMDDRLQFHFSIIGLPADEYVRCQAIQLSVESADGAVWRGGLSVFPIYTGPSNAEEGCLIQPRWPASLRPSLEAAPLRVRASVFVTRLEHGRVVQIPVGQPPVRFENLGLCTARSFRTTDSLGSHEVADVECRRAFVDVASLAYDTESYSPFPADLVFNPVQLRRWRQDVSSAGITATVRLPLDYVRLDVDAPSVNLADFDFTK